MADKKITDLVELNASAANDDLLAIVDASDNTGSSDGTSKQITAANLLSGAPDNSTPVTLATVASNYLSLSGQELTAGTVPVSLGGTGATTAAAARTSLGLGTAATQTVGTSANNVVQLDSSAKLPAVDGSALTNLPSSSIAINDLTDVTITSASNEDVIKWNGSNFVNGQASVNLEAPLATALRGTDNPHIGANPNQSFKVTDNPNKSVMVIADADGNLEFVTKDGANVFINTPSSRLALAKGFSIQADGAEPDIEAVDTDGTTYSVISGDTDTKGANGLPIRQGFNLPDIGAYPAPILISGGSIA